MLNVRNKHIDFGEQLQPPPGFVIDYAVATTFTLDLYALLSIPLAMYYKQSLDSEVSEENFQVLEAIQSLQKHLKIYCHKGKISVPKSTSVSLLAFIENCVTEVVPSSPFQSFHPKVWALRFKSIESKEVRYRLIVMSRNLTFDKSYDIAYWMEGEPKGSAKAENVELIQLMKKLDKESSFSHKRFIRDLARVKFELCDHFNSYNFSYFPKKESKQSIDLDTVYKQRLVVSPFLSDKMVSELQQKSKKKLIVFSRKNELDKLSEDTCNTIEPYYFSQEIVDHHLYENAEEGERDDYFTGEWDNNLHAKIFLRENGNGTFWDLGSANCSDPAFQRNYEFLINLSSNLWALSIYKAKESLLQEHHGVKIFKEYIRSIEKTDAIKETDFREIEYSLIKTLEDPDKFNARLEANPKNNRFNLIIEINPPKKLLSNDYNLYCKPIGLKGISQQIINQGSIIFSDIPIHKLSSFLHWQIKVNKTEQIIDVVSKAEIKNMPEYRLSNIFKSIIDNPEKFMLLLMALLTDEPVGGLVNDENKSMVPKGNNRAPASFKFNMPIYEELILNLSRSPERLQRLSALLEKLNDLNENEIIPKEFSKLWKTIKELLPNEGMAR